MQTTHPKTIKVACVGDSITEVYGYPQQLQTLLGEKYSVLNFGFCGSTVALDSETPYMHYPIFWRAKASQPDTVIIMLGTNDAQPSLQRSNGNFIHDYLELISQFQNLPSKPKIWLVKPSPVFNDGNGLSSDCFDKEILPKIEAVAKEKKLPLIDLHSLFVDQPECFPDGVHPDSEAICCIANAIYNALTGK
jgi:acyl-CoA thioesterase I